MRIERLSGDSREATWALVGEVDTFASAELCALIMDEAEQEHGMVFDLSRVTFIDSTALGVLLGGSKRAPSRGLRFALRTNVSPVVMRVFDATSVQDRFEWVGGDDDGSAGVREPRRPRPSGGSATASGLGPPGRPPPSLP